MSSGQRVVSNSSPLIWLAKIDRLILLKTLFGEVIIPKRVCTETTSGESADSILIRKAVEESWIKVSEEDTKEAQELVQVTGIHLGEAEAILLARKTVLNLLIDEREASATAQVFGVRPVGTVAVLLLALAKTTLTYREFKDCLDLLITSGFWLTVDVYSRALEEAQTIANKGEQQP
jgi:predicted nucleic acid-binding protein